MVENKINDLSSTRKVRQKARIGVDNLLKIETDQRTLRNELIARTNDKLMAMTPADDIAQYLGCFKFIFLNYPCIFQKFLEFSI